MAYMEDYLRKLALWHTKTFKPIMTHDELELIMVKLGFVALPPVSSSSSSSSSPPAAAAAAAAANNNNNNSSGGTPAAWKEYVFTAGGCRNPWTTEPLPRPRLPYPRIDGLHHYTYRAFCDAVSYFIGKRNIADHLHVRGMPLDRKFDRPFDKKFRSMNEEEMLYVYREGTLDQATIMLFNNTDNSKNNNNNSSSNKINNNNNYNNNISNSISSKAAAGGAGGNTNKNTSVNSISFLVPLKDIIV